MSVKAVVIPTSLKEQPYLTTITDYKSYYPIIGCRAFDVVTLYEDANIAVDAFVDDEGLLNESPVNEYFLRAYQKGIVSYPLHGICVITLSDTSIGDSTEIDLPLVKKALKQYAFSDAELSAL